MPVITIRLKFLENVPDESINSVSTVVFTNYEVIYGYFN